ncbi:phage tail spike protein [Rossellomorea sp. y25]|uniref:phage tail spike protein n=1 Tax=Rossellomorea sp. y25 TaxID=3118174 RepID=UPI0030E3C0EA
MKLLLKALDLQRNVTAILENAKGISYTRINNQIWKASFSLPINNPKVDKVKLLKYVEVYDEEKYIGLFRIIPKKTSKSTLTVSFECEHVLATLLGSTLFKDHQLTNLPTNEVLQYLIDQQKEKHWQLGNVEIIRYFHYLWENENLLSAIFSVTKPFDEQYRWTWDTTSYPWTLNLVRPNTEPVCRIKERHNLIDFEIEENPMSVFNRIYPLGYGEGVNQLTIESINNGFPYIEDAAAIAENGIIETTWADKRFEDAATLKASAEALLKKWKEPVVSWVVSAADVSTITGAKVDELKEGNVVRLELDDYPNVDLLIMKEHRPDIKGDPGNTQLEIGSLTEDLSTTQADLERRQKINEVYAQGATNLLAYSYNDNADGENPAEIMIFLPEEMVKINKLLLTYKTDYFRAYEQATEGGGATTVTSSAGGGTTVSSSSGGGTSSTSSAGGGTSTSTAAGGDHSHRMFLSLEGPIQELPNALFQSKNSAGQAVNVVMPANNVDLYTYSSSGSHVHVFTLTDHVHTFTTQNHTHSITLQHHSHTTTLPNHIHAIKFGIYKHTDLPTRISIKVDGNVVDEGALEIENLDLLPYLEKDSEGKVTRGWHTVSITPDDLGRINANVITQFFMQSRGGGSF